MQTIRINNQLYQVLRGPKRTPPTYLITPRKMSLFPRCFATELAPAGNVFRLLEQYTNEMMDTRNHYGPQLAKRLRTFSPRFDVTENQDSYELHGELPGIEQKDVSVEFTDAQTLTIKGRTERQRTEGERPVGLVESQQSEQSETSEGSQYHQPSVEDEGQQAETPEDSSAVQTPVHDPKPTHKPHSRHWLSERSVGEFARTFSFPSRVGQENVKASLKDGILSIIVPKAQAPTTTRINIE